MAKTRVATRAGAAESGMDDLFAAAGGAAVRKGVAAKCPEVAPYWKNPRGVAPRTAAETPIETGASATRLHGSGARCPAALIRWYRSAQLGLRAPVVLNLFVAVGRGRVSKIVGSVILRTAGGEWTA